MRTGTSYYRCSYTDCSLHGIPREIAEHGAEPLVPEARTCGGTAEDGHTCGRLLDRLPGWPADDKAEHVPSTRPTPPAPPAEPTAAERKAAALAQLRAARATALAASDYTQLPDVQGTLTAAQRTEAAAYRQALRDLPKAADPTTAVLPTAPTWLGAR